MSWFFSCRTDLGNVKGFRYLYEDELKLIGKKINELFEKNNVKN